MRLIFIKLGLSILVLVIGTAVNAIISSSMGLRTLTNGYSMITNSLIVIAFFSIWSYKRKD